MTGRLGHLPPEPDTHLALAADVAGWGLGRATTLRDRPLADPDWETFFTLVKRQRLTGFLAEATRADSFAMTPHQRDELFEVHGFLVRRVLLLESVLVEVVRHLEALGIGHRVLKGAALAHTVYPDPAVRPYVDIDVLVPSSDFDAAVEGLIASGATRVRPEPRPGFVSRFGKSVELTRPDRVSIDLHRALAPGAWAVLMNPADMFDTHIDVQLLGFSVHGLGPAERFMHACYHATVGSQELRLIALRDVVQSALAPDFDERAAVARADAWGASTVAAVAVRLAWDVFRPTARPTLVDWARSHRPEPHADRLFEITTGISEDPGPREVLEMLRAIPGLRAKVSYVNALTFPGRDYLAARGQSRASRLLQGARLLRRR